MTTEAVEAVKPCPDHHFRAGGHCPHCGATLPRSAPLRLPIITVQMLADLGQEGFFEKTDKPVMGVKGVSWSQAAVDFACMLGVHVERER